MENILNYNQNLILGFERVLKCLPEGLDYNDKPPRKTEDLPMLTDEEVEALLLNEVGETTKPKDFFNYSKQDLDLTIEEGLHPRYVSFPTPDDLDGLEIFGIDGSNQRLENPCFNFILARGAIVNFRYTKGTEKPYFYTKFKDASAVVQIDGNVFTKSIKGMTYDRLYDSTKNQTKDQQALSIYDHLSHNTSQKPFLLGYNHNIQEKNPASHALGWAVKLMNVLELQCFESIPTDRNLVCIKDGPLFSTSSTPADNIAGLRHILSWEKGILVSVSKRVSDSRLLLDIFCQFPELLEYYFKNQNITPDTIRSIGTDALILPRILSPGQRTPLIKAIPIARRNYVTSKPDLFPLVCYYMRKTKPHNIIRLEIPIFMFRKNPEAVQKAISVVAWQFELGVKAPLIQLAADERCQVAHEIHLLRQQTASAIDQKKLLIPSYY